MQVVRHDDEGIERDFRSDFGSSFPFDRNDPSSFIEAHLGVDHLAEKAPAIVGADRHEVAAGLGIVVFAEANRAAMIARPIGGHP